MMKFYILDDLLRSVKSLENIIETKNLGEVIGENTDSEKAVPEILTKKPDIVIIDLLMPKKDGISVVKEVLAVNPDILFIMISQVVDKNIISDAYDAGIEFFITKPNNVIEIENVIRKVSEKKNLENMLNGIKSVIGTPAANAGVQASEPVDNFQSQIKKILGSIGILGESGTKDIMNIFEELRKENQSYDSKITINLYSQKLGEDPKIVKQRIRRAIKRGLKNIASLGIEDSYSDTYSEYNILFSFESIRMEMELLRNNAEYGGRPSIDTFFEGIEVLCESN